MKLGFMRYLQLYGVLIIYSLVTVCSKKAAGYPLFSTGFLLFLGLEVLVLGVYAILWQQVLKKFSLIYAISSKGCTIILGLLWSVIFFQEQITWNNLAGAGIIMLGIWVVAGDG